MINGCTAGTLVSHDALDAATADGGPARDGAPSDDSAGWGDASASSDMGGWGDDGTNRDSQISGVDATYSDGPVSKDSSATADSAFVNDAAAVGDSAGAGDAFVGEDSSGDAGDVSIEGFTTCQGMPTMPVPTFNFGGAGYAGGSPIPDNPPTITYSAGTHVVTSQIVLLSGDVLRGAGRNLTTLYFPYGLKQMGLPCRDGNYHTTVGPGQGDCYDWSSTVAGLYMGVIGMEGSEIGIEDLTIEFPADHDWTHYGNYNYTSGYNGVEVKNCTNCWIKNVTIKNADNGIMVANGSHQTLEGVQVYARPGGGHIHIAYVASQYSLATNFRMYGSSSHGLVNNWGGTANVFANGWSENVRLEADHSCGGTLPDGRPFPCTDHLLYSNIAGTIGSIQESDRAGNPVDKILWNVGVVDRCPLDAYTAQRR